MNELILASKSPRRRELMKLLGHPFRSVTSHVEETAIPGETPSEHVVRLAVLKAREVGKQVGKGIVIGSDTIVVIDDVILGKPNSEEEAAEMLDLLQGRTHTVYTGFALFDPGNGALSTGFETTEVTMRRMNRNLIEKYIATGEPLDKAGAYGIQGYGAVIIPAIRGCYFNVMGLPLARIMEELYRFSGGRYGFFGNTGSHIHETLA
ncbi:MAG: Maf family protein [Candidatus Latescibacter sp.]|nr:Maf family protein [Candidatus Latescibacter sp.]